MNTKSILKAAGLKPELIAQMEATRRMTAFPCPTCGAGKGRFCTFGYTSRDGSSIESRVHRLRPQE